MNICIIIPAYNESNAIGSLIELLKLKSIPIVVINDGSTDDTGLIAQSAGAVVLTNEHKKGKGFALQRGFQYALDQKYDGVITMDADGQHSPEDIDQFLKYVSEKDVGLIIGNRMGNAEGMPWLRYCVNWSMSAVISLASGQSVADTQCGYRYISSKILKDLNFTSSDFEIETEMIMKAAKKGFKVRSVSIKTIYRNEISKIHPAKDTLRFITYFIRELFSR